MKVVKFKIDGEIDINMLITFSTSTVPVRNDVINLTDNDTKKTIKVRVMNVEHFINYKHTNDPFDPSTNTINHDYVLHCETITE